jgi:hypothetical protein
MCLYVTLLFHVPVCVHKMLIVYNKVAAFVSVARVLQQ